MNINKPTDLTRRRSCQTDSIRVKTSIHSFIVIKLIPEGLLPINIENNN